MIQFFPFYYFFTLHHFVYISVGFFSKWCPWA